ncbi:BTAD domain-containing putative transcriptional regulator [Streptomyces sp. NPDC046215]|uniref:BTAD domain-containing putative transcriptional regulator n=1 Tax=Streptomyces stramineus TaxID=173861 RepID=A0ABP3JF39_9ACTN
MRFGVLGPLVVWDAEGKPVRVREAKARALLADLLVHEGRTVSADRLVDDLWGAEPPARTANALQAKVSVLRRSLGRDRVVHQRPGYRLRLEPGETDADRFEELVLRARATGEPRARAALLADALRLWRGPAYADFADEEFARAAARRLEEQRLTALEEQAEARLAAGEGGGLVAELTALVARHPLRERLRAAQVRALYRAGRQSEALASYGELRDRLAEELGLDPGPELAALHRSVLVQAPELAPGEDASPARPLTNLPAPLTELVGRERPVAEVRELLARCRLVTLTGPGGVGKTRLAVEAAGGLLEAFPDGVWLVELAGQRGSAAALTEVVAAVLGVRDDGPGGGGPGGVRERLAAALRDRRALLVLDNCEHVVEPVAELAGALLGRAPGLRVLATSQEPLGVPGETVRAVEPLPPADAARLFTARAAAAAPGPGGSLSDPADREAVDVICRRLDGIPLALELAATRVRALGVRELADRLGDRFRVLAGGHRGAPARQQTLRAVIDWSWELLSAPERIVLRRLAVHSDGCTLESAEAVCAGEGVAAEEVLGLLVRLVDRSLVVMADGPEGPRYRLLESVAAYGVERLHEMDDFAPVRLRHLRHCIEFAERACPHLREAGQRVWLRRLDAETANMRAALDTAVSGGAAEEALHLVSALSWYWLMRGRLAEARRSMESALSLPGAVRSGLRAEVRALHGGFALMAGVRTPPSPLSAFEEIEDAGCRARGQWFHAYALFNTGDMATSIELTGQALAGFRERGDTWGVAAALALRAMHDLVRGDAAALRRHGERSAQLFRELGDDWGLLRCVHPLASLAEIDGDYAESARLLREGLGIAERLGLAIEVSSTLSALGRLALLGREWGRARELHGEALRLAAEQGFKFGEVHAELGLALGARREGDLARAEALLLRIRDWYGTASEGGGNALVLAELGFVAELRGDAEAARARHLEGLSRARLSGSARALALALEGLSGAEALAGRAKPAALLLGAASAARASAGAPLPPAERGDVDRIAQSARTALGERAFAGAFTDGEGLSPEQAVAAAGLAGGGS